MTTLNKLFNNIPEKQHVLGSICPARSAKRAKRERDVDTELKEIGDQDRPEKDEVCSVTLYAGRTDRQTM